MASFNGNQLNNLSLVYAGANTAWAAYKLMSKSALQVQASARPYRPAAWKLLPTTQADLILLRSNINLDEVVGKETTNEGDSVTVTQTVAYFFDAIIREEHSYRLRITDHPIQTGANIVDHAYMLPAELTLEIGMSDVMDSLWVGQFLGGVGGSRSKSAFDTLRRLQALRVGLNVTTRLARYSNMLIESIHTPDDYMTTKALKCSVRLKEVFLAEVQKEKRSAIPSATDFASQATSVVKEVPKLQTTALGTLAPVYGSTADKLKAATDGVKQLAGAAPPAVQNIVGGLVDSLSTQATDIVNTVTNLAQNPINVVIDTFPDVKGVMNWALEKTNNSSTSLIGAADKLLGISDKISTCLGKLRDATTTIKNTKSYWEESYGL